MAGVPLLKKADAVVRWALVAFGCSGAVASAHYIYTTYIKEPPEKNEGLLQIAAITLSSSVVSKTLSDAEIHRELAAFGLKVLAHPVTVRELKSLAVSEFTNDTPTRANLRHFAVDDVVKDHWVKEELTSVAQEVAKGTIADPAVYPSTILRWLGNCALTALNTNQFKNDLKRHLLWATWEAFLVPLPPGTKLV